MSRDAVQLCGCPKLSRNLLRTRQLTLQRYPL